MRQVLPSPKIKHHLEVLILQELLVEDSGIYVCIMNNTAGAERIEVNLTVRSSLDTLQRSMARDQAGGEAREE